MPDPPRGQYAAFVSTSLAPGVELPAPRSDARTLGPFDTAALSPAPDASAAAWLAQELTWEATAASGVGNHFEAYARVFHPASIRVFNDGPLDMATADVTWREVALANGRVMHPAAEWGSIVGSWKLNRQGGSWDGQPTTGSLPLETARSLSIALSRHTTTPEQAWFGVWEGAGAPSGPPIFEIPGRTMLLFGGPVLAPWLPNPGAPNGVVNLWWPEDRAWCVSTDIDLMTTYVGGTRACIDAILRRPNLEACEVPPDQSVTITADTLNPDPA
jgi:hypothetical protein